ncbi:P-loop containing nucleoside triphosphate hydrolase protein [Hyaloraphidium curvatum]|nr:P-loop containing nucleoside triphosphate hydrolase protein [Hyaloraphidium curvatum]
MPPLQDIRQLLNPGNQVLNSALEKLAAVGILTDRDVLLADERDLAARAGIDAALARDVRAHLSEAYSANCRTGSEALEAAASLADTGALKAWTMGCEGVDALLDGGIHHGDVVELSGPSNQGKTQLCFYSAVCAVVLSDPEGALRQPLGTVVYVDTANSFSATRILELFNGSDRFASARSRGVTNQEILSCVRVMDCYDAYAMIGMLEELDVALSKGNDFYSRMQLLVIDSVASVLSPVLSMKQGTGQMLAATIARMMRSIAANHGVAVLVVNHAVSARDEGVPRGTKPALGMIWQGVPTVRLFLRPDDDQDTDEHTGGREGMVWTYEAADGTVMRLFKRIIEVRNSTRTAVGAWAPIFFGQTEVICET